jgi:hypothetical protein
MPTINATISQGGYLVNTRATSLWTWDDVCYNMIGATSVFTNPQYMYTRAAFSSGRSGTYSCGRGYLVFDTSAITGTLTSISLNVWVDSVFDLIYQPDAIVQLTTSPTLSTSLATSDWQYTAGTNASDPFTPITQGWETIGLNGTALSVAETENEMSLILRDNYYDYSYYSNFTDPAGEGNIAYFYNEAGYIPYLDYTMITGYGQTVNGVIAANIGNVDGISKINISKVLGV